MSENSANGDELPDLLSYLWVHCDVCGRLIYYNPVYCLYWCVWFIVL